MGAWVATLLWVLRTIKRSKGQIEYIDHWQSTGEAKSYLLQTQTITPPEKNKVA